jgi:hypothetical protein
MFLASDSFDPSKRKQLKPAAMQMYNGLIPMTIFQRGSLNLVLLLSKIKKKIDLVINVHINAYY